MSDIEGGSVHFGTDREAPPLWDDEAVGKEGDSEEVEPEQADDEAGDRKLGKGAVDASELASDKPSQDPFGPRPGDIYFG